MKILWPTADAYSCLFRRRLLLLSKKSDYLLDRILGIRLLSLLLLRSLGRRFRAQKVLQRT
jgi:hypothetical protein